MKFLWLSRHSLTQEQIKELQQYGYGEFVHHNPGVLQNARQVVELAWHYGADGIGLVAPGRIWCSLIYERPDGLEVYEAESRQAPELRKGEEPIPFVHVKFWRIMGDGVISDAGEPDAPL